MNKRPTKLDVALEQFKANSIFAFKDVLTLFDNYVRETRQAVREKESLKSRLDNWREDLYESAKRLNHIAGSQELKPYPKLRSELRSLADSLLRVWRGYP